MTYSMLSTVIDAVVRQVAVVGRRSSPSSNAPATRSIARSIGMRRCILPTESQSHRLPQVPVLVPNHRNSMRTMIMITQTKGTLDPNDENSDPMNRSLRQQPPPDDSSTLQTPTNVELSVIVTDACYQRIHDLIEQKKRKKEKEHTDNDADTDSYEYYLRVFVDAGGCSGFTYQFELDTDTNFNPTEDVVFAESQSSATVAATTTTTATTPARVVIDRGSLSLLAGSKIDYVQEMIKSTFEVRDNPQSESACGCGSSFAVKNFSSNPAID